MHYVMSDIHGQYDKYLSILKQISFSDEDKLYIIGDVIDRGPKVRDLLLDVLTDDRVEYLLGNHEVMMIDAMSNREWLVDWFRNGATSTVDQLEEEGYVASDIVPLLMEKKVIIPDLVVNEKHFYLTHAAPYMKINGTESESIIKEPMSYEDFTNEQELFNVVWDRNYSYYQDNYCWRFLDNYPETIFLIGHTPVYHCNYSRNPIVPLISPSPNKKVINLDCGCVRNHNLGCLRLEDFAEFYA